MIETEKSWFDLITFFYFSGASLLLIRDSLMHTFISFTISYTLTLGITSSVELYHALVFHSTLIPCSVLDVKMLNVVQMLLINDSSSPFLSSTLFSIWGLVPIKNVCARVCLAANIPRLLKEKWLVSGNCVIAALRSDWHFLNMSVSCPSCLCQLYFTE